MRRQEQEYRGNGQQMPGLQPRFKTGKSLVPVFCSLYSFSASASSCSSIISHRESKQVQAGLISRNISRRRCCLVILLFWSEGIWFLCKRFCDQKWKNQGGIRIYLPAEGEEDNTWGGGLEFIRHQPAAFIYSKAHLPSTYLDRFGIHAYFPPGHCLIWPSSGV